jgi:hypothetical protein
MNAGYRVVVSQAERNQLDEMLGGGKHAARRLKRAKILLAADNGKTDAVTAATVAVGEPTIYRTKRRFVEGNLELAHRANSHGPAVDASSPAGRRPVGCHCLLQSSAHRPWRSVKVTAQRTARDFAEYMRDFVDVHYPQAELMDNLSTHSPGRLV